MAMDLQKKASEIEGRSKDYSALYNVIKTERNKYVNLIQASSQAMAELREKLRVLQGEIDILRSESKVKDGVLGKERVAHQTSQYERDQLRVEFNRFSELNKERLSRVNTQVVEIEKLNSVINRWARAAAAVVHTAVAELTLGARDAAPRLPQDGAGHDPAEEGLREGGRVAQLHRRAAD